MIRPSARRNVASLSCPMCLGLSLEPTTMLSCSRVYFLLQVAYGSPSAWGSWRPNLKPNPESCSQQKIKQLLFANIPGPFQNGEELSVPQVWFRCARSTFNLETALGRESRLRSPQHEARLLRQILIVRAGHHVCWLHWNQCQEL